MEPAHPAESKMWTPAIAVALVSFVFFTVIGEGKLLFVLRFLSLGVFIALVTGALVAEVLLKHGYWAEARRQLIEESRRSGD